MPKYQEKFTVNIPIEVVEEALNESVKHLWNIISQESERLLVEERLLSKEPYDPTTFVGATQMDVLLKPVDEGTEIACEATNQYYGDDPPPSKEYDFSNGHYRAQEKLKTKVTMLRMRLEQKAKSWSAKQRYQAVQEQRSVPQLISNNSVTTPSLNNTIVDVASSGLKPEQLSIEDFVAQLERLAALQRSGALTDAEFQQAKTRLLKATE